MEEDPEWSGWLKDDGGQCEVECDETRGGRVQKGPGGRGR